MPDMGIIDPSAMTTDMGDIPNLVFGYVDILQSINQLDTIGLITVFLGMLLIMTCISGLYLEVMKDHKVMRRRVR